MNKTLSTTAVARLLGVAVGSVSNWIDQGKLKAGRTPGGHRRVLAPDLVEFLEEHKLPIPPELVQTAPTLLIVDDESNVSQWLAREIEQACPDCEVLTAGDGFVAGELVASEQPDVVILDIMLPGLDGFEVCQRIKQRETTRDIEVIAITANCTDEVRERILACGARACLPKPLQPEQILELINPLLR